VDVGRPGDRRLPRVDDHELGSPVAGSQKYCVVTGKHSPMLAPATTMTCAESMSDHGLAVPRSMPKAFLFAAAAETMQRRPL